MAKFNWDRVRKENLAKRHGAEHIASESEKYGGLHHDTRRDLSTAPHYCPHCTESVTLEGLRAHILRFHRSAGGVGRRRRKQSEGRVAQWNPPVQTKCPQCGVGVKRLQKHLNRIHGGTPNTLHVETAPARPPKAVPRPGLVVSTLINIFFVPRTKRRARLAEEILTQQGAVVTLKEVKDDALTAEHGGTVYFFGGTSGRLAGAVAIVELLADVCKLSAAPATVDRPSRVSYALWLTK